MEDRRVDELVRMGIPADEAQAWVAAQEPEGEGQDQDAEPPVEIWPENRALWRVWMLLQSQWRYFPRGQLQGLRLDAADLLISRLRLDDGDRVFEQLIEMEHAALEAEHG